MDRRHNTPTKPDATDTTSRVVWDQSIIDLLSTAATVAVLDPDQETKPSAIRPVVADLIRIAAAGVGAVGGIDPLNPDGAMLQRVRYVNSSINTILSAARVLETQPRSAKSLLVSRDRLLSVIDHLLDPQPSPITDTQRRVALSVPPLGVTLLSGLLIAGSVDRGLTPLSFLPDEYSLVDKETWGRFMPIFAVLDVPGEYRLKHASGWTKLGATLVRVATGYGTRELPPLLITAGEAIGQQVSSQYQSGDWSVHTATVREWCVSGGFIRIRQ